MTRLTDAKRRLVDHLRRVDSASASEIATAFGLTDSAVRQHLDSLLDSGFVERVDAVSGGRGRPATRWQLTAAARTTCADRHDLLATELLEAIQTELGDDALARVIDARARRQTELSRLEIDERAPRSLEVRVASLAAERTRDGYDAEVRRDDEGLWLIEHHCPICAAATACPALCDSELSMFRAVLGNDVQVTRDQHLLGGDRRCAYRIVAA
jgi:predicted ArsR family transcriptional regulator